MTLAFLPQYRWQLWAALALVLLVVLVALAARRLTAAGVVVPSRVGASPRSRIAVMWLTAAAALLLAAALAGPALIDARPGVSFHVPVVVDVSDSVLRAAGGWPVVRRGIADRLQLAFADRPASTTGQILPFRSDAAAFRSIVPLHRIADEIRQLDESAFGSGTGTNIGNALLRAAAEIERSGGRGAVVLVSDGNETDGDAEAAAQQLARRGIAIYTVPLEGGPPELGIVAANLPAYIDAGTTTYVRGVLNNQGDDEASAVLALARHALPGPERGRSSDSEQAPVRFAGQQWARFRTAMSFDSPGLQYVDVTLASGVTQRRRLFTNVESPPRVLAIGDDGWTNAFAPGSIVVVRKAPADLTPADAYDGIDAFVIDGVPAGVFVDGVLAKIASTVTSRGTGLFVMNGRHLGGSRDRTNLMTFKETPLDALLPLIPGPRPRESEQARHVVLVIDSSGSMCGGRLDQAKQISEYLVIAFLKSQDRLDLLTFTTGASLALTGLTMTDQGKTQAIDEIRRIACGGGTDPTQVLQELTARSLSNCALLFFSDGEFGTIPARRPDCRTTVFGIRSGPFSSSESIRELADPIPVDERFDPTRLKIPALEPRRQDHFFEPGSYRALSMRYVVPRTGALEIPNLPLDGTATTFVKSQADLAAVRSKLTDPVLAYAQSRFGIVGELTTAIPDEWLAREEGRRAIQQWIAATFPLTDQRRYLFQISQDGSQLDLEIALSPREGRLPVVDHMEAHIVSDATADIDISLRRDDTQPATFRGRVTLPEIQAATAATLVLQESGSDALPRPQRISMLLPPRDHAAAMRGPEAFSFGVNGALLERLAEVSGGAHDQPDRLERGQTPSRATARPIWPILATLACLCHLAAIFLFRLDL